MYIWNQDYAILVEIGKTLVTYHIKYGITCFFSKVWLELTKIGHTFRKHTATIGVFKKSK